MEFGKERLEAILGQKVVHFEKFESQDGILSGYYKARTENGQKLFVKTALPETERFRFFIDKFNVDVTEIEAYEKYFPDLMEFEKQVLGKSTLKGKQFVFSR